MKKSSPVIVMILLVLAAAGLAWWRWSSAKELSDDFARSNGRLEMTRADVAVKYPGRLTALSVREGDLVQAGQVIAQQDDSDILAQLAGAQAAKARAQAALIRATGERDARAQQARLAGVEWRETAKLRDAAMVSPVELEQRQIARDAAGAGVLAASGGVGEARAAIAQADAQIRQLQAMRADLRIVAPCAGRVEYRIVEPGAMLPPGGRVVSLVNPGDVYLTIFLPAAAAGRLLLGDEARILPEGFADPVPARVSFVAPEAQFTPKFLETASEREKLSYRVKLSIAPDVARRLDGRLKAGMTADGYVRFDPAKPWPHLAPRQN